MAIYLGKAPVDNDDYIFISYKKENCDKLTEVVSRLDFDVWYDIEINAGDDWEEKIASHLIGSKAVIFFLSKDFLREGKQSFPFREYKIAEKNHKKMYFVYLEKVDENKDVPLSIVFEYENIIAKQCIGYEGDLSSDELVEKINEAIAKLPSIKNSPDMFRKPTPIKEYYMLLYSSLFNGKIEYIGSDDLHLSDDLQKICLYNREKNIYEVRDTDNMDTVIYNFAIHRPMFGSAKTPQNARIFYSGKNQYIYYVAGDDFHIYDVIKRKWNICKTTSSKNEIPYYIQSSDENNIVILFFGNDKYLTTIKFFDVSQGKFVKIWDVKRFNLCNKMVSCMKDNGMFWVLFTDSSDKLRAIDVRSANIIAIDHSNANYIRNYFEQPYNIQKNPDFDMSRDGFLFSTDIVNGWRINDSESGTVLTDIFAGTVSSAFLLKNKAVLLLCPDGSVSRKTFQGTQTVFSPQYFLNTPEFEKNLPHTMNYDEEHDNFIFIVRVKTDKNIVEKMVVVDKNGKVVGTSTYMYHRFSRYVCYSKIIKDKLCVMFRGDDGSKKAAQETVVYMCQYK